MSQAGILGTHMEQRACQFLTQQGFQIVCRNYRTRCGEIDCIAQNPGLIVFVEVRYRQSCTFGGAKASVTLGKQRKLTRAAQHYLQQHPIGDRACRFDVIALSGNPKLPNLEWIPNAFEAV